MADLLPVEVPEQYTRAGNTDHEGRPCPIADSARFSYGTAGFRQPSSQLPFIVYRVGYLAGLRARHVNGCVGVMLTASHNPAGDNGVKIVDPMGEMLAGDWEKFASELIAAGDDQLPTAVRALEVQTPMPHRSSRLARVVCAMDTRSSGPHLLAAVKAGCALMNVEFIDAGVLTTPQLHFIVRCSNDPTFGAPTEIGYYTAIGDAFTQLYQLTPLPAGSAYSPVLSLDCANGVGGPKMRLLHKFIPHGALDIHYRNEGVGQLNYKCGADFVKIDRLPPSEMDGETLGAKCASFDGDADRLVYFIPRGASIELLDGDKIALLLAKYITDQVSAAGLSSELTMGIVQTAYANGNSSKYIREQLGRSPVFVPTGVKHLHHEAVKYDIGVYFEANGHGTVVFSDKFKQAVASADQSCLAVQRLRLISRVINEVVGDALADLLACELCLRHYGWSVQHWADMYADAPNIQIKVPVNDRSLFKTTFEETTLLQPEGMQAKIDALVAEYKESRAFVRPSGTENIVRVYAEADTVDNTKALGERIADLVRAM